MADILLLNGPNLNLLGKRQPEIYGHHTLKQITQAVDEVVSIAGHKLTAFQSNHEGQLIDFIHKNSEAQFLLLNAAAFTHTSIALRDAVKFTSIPFVEIHLSNVYKREPFRHSSFFSDISQSLICGCGYFGYVLAAQFAVHFLENKTKI